jgi:hypothetical protein
LATNLAALDGTGWYKMNTPSSYPDLEALGSLATQSCSK